MLDAAPAFLPEPTPPLPVAKLVLGRPVDEVATLLPRLFNLCRAAQARAVRGALGLSTGAGDDAQLRSEILRDHVLRLCLVLPRHLGQAQVSLPDGWQAGGPGLRRALFGPTGRLPDRPEAFEAFLGSTGALGRLLSAIAELFGPGVAVPPDLPLVSDATALDPTAAVENSPAGRQAAHPVLADLATRHGRGPLWRAAGRAYDLEALLDGRAPAPVSLGPGAVAVPATRGLYAVRARAEAGRVTAFVRVTPTDHLMAPGGVCAGALATLPADRGALAPLLIDILDPCMPVRIRESAHA